MSKEKTLNELIIDEAVNKFKNGDIKNLKFENINWEENYIEFNQVKTSNYMKLPLTNEVGNFIIDYIKNSRPSSLENYIFLRYTFPYIKISRHNNLREYIINICQKLNIDLTNKEKITFQNYFCSVNSYRK